MVPRPLRLVLAVLAVTTGAGLVPAAAAKPDLAVSGTVVDADGTPVAGARFWFSTGYPIAVTSESPKPPEVSRIRSHPAAYRPPGPPDGTTGADGAFRGVLPDRIRADLFDGAGDLGGFSVLVEMPASRGELRGPVTRVTTTVRRGTDRTTLPVVRAWRPRTAVELLNPAQVRLRWSGLPDGYGGNLTGIGAALVAADPQLPASGPMQVTGRYAARADLRDLPPGAGWAAVVGARVGEASEAMYTSPLLPLPRGPAAVSVRRPCVVVGTRGSVVRGGPCAAVDGDLTTSPGTVFPQSCPLRDRFCDAELPELTAVDLGRSTEVALVRVHARCRLRCNVLTSHDGVHWRAATHAREGTRCSSPYEAEVLVFTDFAVQPGEAIRYVGVSGGEWDQVEMLREAGSLPRSSPDFDVDEILGDTRMTAVDVRELSVFTGADPYRICDSDHRLPALEAPPVAKLPGAGGLLPAKGGGRSRAPEVAAVLLALAVGGYLTAYRGRRGRPGGRPARIPGIERH